MHSGPAPEPLPPVCILAGGRGLRLGGLTSRTPKPLLEVAGRPFIEHQLDLLQRGGAQRIVICTGYLGDLFERTLGDGARLGLELRYSSDGDRPAGTAGAVRRALALLGGMFLVLYGDTYLRIDYADVVRRFRDAGRPALMTVLRNRGRWDVSNAAYRNGLITAYDKEIPPPGASWIDYGLLVFRSEVFAADPRSDLSDLTRDLASRGELAGYRASRRFYEIGTREGLAQTERFLARARAPTEAG